MFYTLNRRSQPHVLFKGIYSRASAGKEFTSSCGFSDVTNTGEAVWKTNVAPLRHGIAAWFRLRCRRR